MNTMTAIFTGDIVDRLLPLYRERCIQYSEGNFNLTAGRHHTLDGWDGQVSGPAQEVMAFIGFAADNGEDGLLSVSRA